VKRAILLVDHGSRRPEANAQLEAVAAEVAKRAPDVFVTCAHMELAPPDIAAGIAACAGAGADAVVVHPYFLAPGRHTTRDIPRLVREAAALHPGLDVRVSEPLGLHPKLVEVVLDRVAQARGRA
jgi:sirohydrochlorin ferrochelatase